MCAVGGLNRRPVMEPTCSYSPCINPTGSHAIQIRQERLPKLHPPMCFLSLYSQWEEARRYCAGCAPSHTGAAPAVPPPAVPPQQPQAPAVTRTSAKRSGGTKRLREVGRTTSAQAAGNPPAPPPPRGAGMSARKATAIKRRECYMCVRLDDGTNVTYVTKWGGVYLTSCSGLAMCGSIRNQFVTLINSTITTRFRFNDSARRKTSQDELDKPTCLFNH